MTRLCTTALRDYNGPARLPVYDRTTVTPGILHLGLGAFPRAHVAVYVDDRLAEAPDWGIIGVSLRRPETRQALAPQDGLYTLGVRAPDGLQPRVVGSVLQVLDMEDGPDPVLDLIADPRIRLITVTVTEKGYHRGPGGGLDTAHPDVAADLALHPPRTLPGLLARGLARRKAEGAGSVTVLSCDNLPENGAVLRRVVGDALSRIAPADVGWVADNVTFPLSMVDRITPATTDADRDETARLTGLEDAWPVVTEPFSQWVIEDRFAAGRPPFDRAGAQIVTDVRPWETMKLRLLNGAHSAMAYMAPRLGHVHVSEAAMDPRLTEWLTRMALDEVLPGLDVPGADLPGYWAALLTRFRNTAIRHRLDQIAQDGSQKLPQRLLAPLADATATGRPAPMLETAVAAWVVTVMEAAADGRALADPMDAALRNAAKGGDALTVTRALFGPDGLVDTALADHPEVLTAIARNTERLRTMDAREVLADLIDRRD
jgi:fructuronate reductase